MFSYRLVLRIGNGSQHRATDALPQAACMSSFPFRFPECRGTEAATYRYIRRRVKTRTWAMTAPTRKLHEHRQSAIWSVPLVGRNQGPA